MAVLGNSVADLTEDETRHAREGTSTRSSSGSSCRDSLPMPPPRHGDAHPRPHHPPGAAATQGPRHQTIPRALTHQAQSIQAHRPSDTGQARPTPQAHSLSPPGRQMPQIPVAPSARQLHQSQPVSSLPQNLSHQSQLISPLPQNPMHQSQPVSSLPQNLSHQSQLISPLPQNSMHQSQPVSSLPQNLSHQSQLISPLPQNPMHQSQPVLSSPQNTSHSSLHQNTPHHQPVASMRQTPSPQDVHYQNMHMLQGLNIPQSHERVESSPESRVYDRLDQYSQNESDSNYDSLDRNTDSLERNLNQPEPNKVVTKAVLGAGGAVETLATSPSPRRSVFSFEEQRASPALLSRGAGAGGTPGGRSVRDDGYCSAGSTPLSIGHHKRTKHGSVVTLSCYKKEPKVQIDDDKYLKDKTPPARNLDLKDGVDDGRETWGTGADFLLSIIGFAVDLANVWRFPYLCYRNGGGAFLIPYTLMLIFGAMPLFYMELILGQYNRQGPISLWKICPLFKGVGFCAVMVAFYVSFYYNVIIGWALYFLVSSARAELPWIHCDNAWNTDKCWDGGRHNTSAANRSDATHYQGPLSHFTPASEFFHRAVLEMQHSEGLNDLGLPKWQLAACLGVVYFTLYLSLFKGVKSSGKVVWATATLPYVVLSILLARGLLLPGAARGIAYYLQPELHRLKDTQVWVDAAVQIFYSVGAGFGVHLSYASYNTFHNNCYRDCLVTTLVNCFTSFFSGFVIFTYLGFMSHKQGVPISAVATEGPGLVFQVYPEAVATLPGASIWAMLFFFMLIMLGLDSGMGGLECVITGLLDEARACGARWLRREHFTLLVVCVSFLVACINVTPGGIYMFHLLDTYAAGISLLCSALFEAVAVSWFYGLERFSDDVEEMLGFRPGIYWRICWKFVSPVFIIGVVVFGLLYQQPLQYQQYLYPEWAALLGWGLALSSILMIPACALYKLLRTPGTFRQKIACCISPESEHEAIRGGAPVSRFTWRHWLYV